MSHLSRIDLVVSDLNCLEKAVKKLGGTLHRGKTQFKYYARDLAPCDHAASFPNCNYELGIIKSKENKNNFDLSWDSYSSGGLTKVLGNNAEKLKQQYAYFVTKQTALRQGMTTSEKVMQDGSIQLRVMVN